jgi:hypothetical protein
MKKIDKKSLITSIISIVLLILSLVFSNKVKLKMELSVLHTESSIVIEKDNKLYKPIDGLNEKDGINDVLEIELALNNTKLYYPNVVNNKIEEDDIKLIEEFNDFYFIDKEVDTEDILKDVNFLNRLYELTTKIIKRNDTKYLNQRLSSDPKIAYNSCVPYSATIGLQTLGIDINPDDLTHYFKGELKEYALQYHSIVDYAVRNYGNWIETYVRDRKLYQIFGVLKYGINIHPKVMKSKYYLKFGYKNINWIENYINKNNTGLVISTFLPYLVDNKWEPENKTKFKGGHAVYLRDILSLNIKENDYTSKEILGVILQDPFGNPNTNYDLLDGHGVLLRIDKFQKCVKTDLTDNRKFYSSDDEIRVLYWDLKTNY